MSKYDAIIKLMHISQKKQGQTRWRQEVSQVTNT